MVTSTSGGQALAENPDTLSFIAGDVTGFNRFQASGVQSTLPAGAVARQLAAQMKLPTATPWSLCGSRGQVLDEALPIGEQLTPGEEVMVVPKAHLG
jgi:hypothetical protein